MIETPLIRDRIREWARHWPGLTFSEVLRGQARRQAAKIALVDRRRRLTYEDLDRLVDRAATMLRSRGARHGDVIACILPNRVEAVILFYAASRAGLALSPIVPIYGAREVRFILRQLEAPLVFVSKQFRGVDLASLVERLRPDLPALREVIAVESPGDAWLAMPDETDVPETPATAENDPNEISVILYTSGTTADPKGVLHSDNTLLSVCARTQAYHRLAAEEVFVIASPVSHISGLLYGVMLPIFLGGTAVLMESWDPEPFLALVEQEGGTFSAGATPFLQGVLECPALGRYELRTLRVFPCGGADVPPELIRRAIGELGVRSGRGYGSTEFPSITSSAGPEVPDSKRAETDGAPVPPNQIELRDAEGRPVVGGREGEIWARGPALCLGYRDPTLEIEAFDDRGFFRTGDLGFLDRDGYLTITGRVKDIIVRGGEKFSAREIEDLLFSHPKVRSVAIVPMPDPQLGERACAFVIPSDPKDPPTLADLTAHLGRLEVSRRKLPERLELVDELPLTASGKVQKQILRERITQILGARDRSHRR